MGGPWDDYKPKAAAPMAGPWSDYSPTAKSKDDLRASRVGQYGAMAQGMTFGWGDEIAGAGAGLATRAKNFLMDATHTSGERQDPDQVAAATTTRIRDQQAAYAAQHPVGNVLNQVVGGLLVPGGPAAKFVGKGAGIVGTAARSALVGAASGAVAGAGNAQGGVGERATGAGQGAAAGAALGAAIPVAGAAAGTTIRAVNAATGGKLIPAAQGAASRLRSTLEQDGLTPEKIQSALDAWRTTGASAPVLMDLAGENTRALLRVAASRPGEARNAAVGYAQSTRENLQGRGIDRTRKLTPDQRPAGQVKTDLEAERKTVSDQLYPAFKADLVPVGDDITSALSGSSGASILRNARRIADARRDAGALQELAALSDGTATHVSAGTLDLVRQGLRDASGIAKRGGQNSIASGLAGRERDVEGALLDVPGFNTARNVHRHYSQRIEAVDHGAEILGDAPDLFAQKVGGMDAEMIEAARVGGRQSITDALGQPANASPVLNRIAFSENAQRNLTALYGREEAQRYIQAARNELARRDHANFISPNTGSQTATRLADKVSVEGLVNALKRPISTAADFVLRGGATMTPAERNALVGFGLSPPEASANHLVRPPRRIGPAAGRAAVVAPNALMASKGR